MTAMSRPPRPGCQKGFTLLELTLALTIVSVLLVLLLGAFQVGHQSWAKGETAIEAHNRQRVTMERLRRQLSAASDDALSANKADAPLFQGGPQTMRFISRASLTPGGDRGLVAVAYDIRDAASDGFTLEFREQPLAAVNPDADLFEIEGDALRLLHGLAILRFAYHVPGSGDADGSWGTSWPVDGHTGLPDAVRIEFGQADEAPVAVVVRLFGQSGGQTG